MAKGVEVQQLNKVLKAAPAVVAAASAPVVNVEVSTKGLQQIQKLCNTLGASFKMLNQDDLCRFCMLIMSEPTASHKDKLTAAKLYAQIKGYLDKNKQRRGANGARIRWAQAPIEAEIVTAK